MDNPMTKDFDQFFSYFSDEELIAFCGTPRDILRHVYTKYCGSNTPIPKPMYLYEVYLLLKLNPHARHWRVHTFRSCKWHWGHIRSDTITRLRYLASVIDEVNESWRQRLGPGRVRLGFAFDDTVVSGALDSFPIYVRRPGKRYQRKCLKNAKYGGNCVVKVQCVFDHSETLIWMDEIRPGVTHDAKLWSLYGCADQMGPRELFLADRAYIGSDKCLAQMKKKPKVQLTREQRDYNAIHGFVRAGGEHGNHDFKVFAILGERFRGHLFGNGSGWQTLNDAVKVIGNTISLRGRLAREAGRPWRSFDGFPPVVLDREGILARAEAVRLAARDAARVKAAEKKRRERERQRKRQRKRPRREEPAAEADSDGMAAVADPAHVPVAEQIRVGTGMGTALHRNINTGFDFDFFLGLDEAERHVLAYSDGEWLAGKITSFNKGKKLLNIKFDHLKYVVRGYHPSEVRPVDDDNPEFDA